ncbi:efflux RND transporter periplasmic adaptor subunit [Paucibacter sp. DJ2R-2]|uniref:efflux RND transporter periplasmic adaptor subunit n=1 Tax=Paucibacter sp. DJ2R-2 TaxID=2893558 RepID=UPI0021E3BA42|nr:efflux RND transporter periplasmic adaptor subunit [Paucibacter sp. DJ2R-2]MCV2420275.1 efflux RND transporter periplasmic adaptor subunit [Paucibacter sp. DJ4R-1]MCV2436780.1 efflux RND transporter periplasmic adaptor subunit [Paucibacter sp. DJ2R-2]
MMMKSNTHTEPTNPSPAARPKKQALAVAVVLALGLAGGWAILRGGPAVAGADAHAHGEGEAAHEEAPSVVAPPVVAASAPATAASSADSGEEFVELSDEQLQRQAIRLEAAGPANLARSLELLGEVKLNQDRSVLVTPRLAGQVEAVRVSAGDRVQAGQVLAVISSQALADQRSELLAAQKRLALARGVYEREKKLWEEKISAEQDYLQARQAFQEAEITAENARQKLQALGAGAAASGTAGLTRYEVRAPMAGVVVEKKISVGEVLKDDAPIFQLADLGTLWVELSLPVQTLGQLQIGARGRIQGAPASEPALTLSHIGSTVAEQSRSAMARLLLPNPRGQWRPGQPVTVALQTGQTGAAGEVTVPVAVRNEALQNREGRDEVYVREGQHMVARAVRLGRSDGSHTEVLQGLSAGERYASANSFVVKADLGKSAAAHAH